MEDGSFWPLEKTSTITSKSKCHSLVMDPTSQEVVAWVLIIQVWEVEGLEEGELEDLLQGFGFFNQGQAKQA
jgi:hypothetical protein